MRLSIFYEGIIIDNANLNIKDNFAHIFIWIVLRFVPQLPCEVPI